MKKITTVEEYINVNTHYSEEITILRTIIASTELEETIKWSMPTYCLKGKNVLGLGAFKNHFCIWFHQGVFLKDEQQLLFNAQEDKTKAMRQMRFTSKADINKAAVLAYVNEAIENQRLGRELKPKRNTKPVVIPSQLNSAFRNNAKFKTAFSQLSISQQREYCNYITEAKRNETKQKRLDKIIPMIISKKGLHDKYSR